MSDWQRYRRKAVGELRPYVEGEDIEHISISEEDLNKGSPKAGDMVARNPLNHNDLWLVSKEYFEKNYEKDDFEKNYEAV